VYSSDLSFIYKATSEGRSVAIKKSLYAGASRESLAKFIEYEERALKTCDNHPNVVRLLDGKGIGPDRELMFEWIVGKTLEQASQFTLEVATQLFREIASATGAINRGGFLHSDLHPKNVMVRDGHAVVIDLGLAYHLHEKPFFHTSGGSEGYRAPERYESRPAAISADVYSLGAVLYYLVRGRHAFYQTDWRRVNDREMPSKIPDVPDWVNEVIQKATQHKPSDRFQTVEELLAALPGE
jgi:serine/threonine protein kinase